MRKKIQLEMPKINLIYIYNHLGVLDEKYE